MPRASKRKLQHLQEENESESEGETSSLHVHHMSEYEKKRLENIRKNNEMLAELNIGQAKQNLGSLYTTIKKKRPAKLKLKIPLPRRQSLRIRKITPDGLPLPEVVPVVEIVPHDIPSGPLNMDPVNDIEETDSKTFLKHLKDLASKVKRSRVASTKDDDKPLSWYEKNLMTLEVREEHVKKVVPQRICSILFHPNQSKTLVFASDKRGRLGIWDVCSSGENEGVYVYQPHSGTINCMAFDPTDYSKLYTCSYDGTIRCADVNKESFHEVCALGEDITPFNYFAFGTTGRQTLLAACGDGYIRVIDGRVGGRKRTAVTELLVHDKTIKCVDVHPCNPNIFLTTVPKGTVAFWDIRNHKGTKSMLSAIDFTRSVSSAFFSPITGNQIVATCMSNIITVNEVSQSGISSQQAKCTFRHDNFTGRWLSNFRATWDPKTDTIFAVGSMKYPRQVDVYSSELKGRPVAQLKHENLNSINSRLAFHPSLNMIVGGNSSGKVYLWTESRP